MKQSKGTPKPFGASLQKKGYNFSLFSKNATKVTLVIEKGEEISAFHFDPDENRTGDVWHVLIEELTAPFVYSYQLDGPRNSPHYFHPLQPLLDPYAKHVEAPQVWQCATSKYHPKGYVPEPSQFDWEGVTSPCHKEQDLIIYEMHVRGFTRHENSGVKHPGTFLGVIEKIPYLKELGITAVELMPMQEFNEKGYSKPSPVTHEKLCNYWGYSTVNYFAPMTRFAVDPHKAAAEFKQLVKELHRNGIEVILDVVFNHTAEKGKNEALFSFMGIDHTIYYMLKGGKHVNYTGCGHTMNLNHPILRQFVKDVLHYWVTEMHVDGFRFDLAAIMNRDTHGNLHEMAPLIEELTHDPILGSTKLIAEPWDLGGYQLGGFFPSEKRWSEWNGKYRDAIRSFIKGDPRSKNEFAARITGSQDIFPARTPSASVNFITAHDGFTLHDLVSYNGKHNDANGEHNKDGSNDNMSWNMGEEGETSNESVLYLRKKQMKNFLVALFISRGVPMLLMGDEYGHTKKGNNNTWCQDNELNWFDWSVKTPLTEFVKKLIALRKRYPVFSKDTFYEGREVVWHGLFVEDPNWDDEMPILACTLDEEGETPFYVAFNPTLSDITFVLPELPVKGAWAVEVDVTEKRSEGTAVEGSVTLEAYSSLVLKYAK